MVRTSACFDVFALVILKIRHRVRRTSQSTQSCHRRGSSRFEWVCTGAPQKGWPFQVGFNAIPGARAEGNHGPLREGRRHFFAGPIQVGGDPPCRGFVCARTFFLVGLGEGCRRAPSALGLTDHRTCLRRHPPQPQPARRQHRAALSRSPRPAYSKVRRLPLEASNGHADAGGLPGFFVARHKETLVQLNGIMSAHLFAVFGYARCIQGASLSLSLSLPWDGQRRTLKLAVKAPLAAQPPVHPLPQARLPRRPPRRRRRVQPRPPARRRAPRPP